MNLERPGAAALHLPAAHTGMQPVPRPGLSITFDRKAQFGQHAVTLAKMITNKDTAPLRVGAAAAILHAAVLVYQRATARLRRIRTSADETSVHL